MVATNSLVINSFQEAICPTDPGMSVRDPLVCERKGMRRPLVYWCAPGAWQHLHVLVISRDCEQDSGLGRLLINVPGVTRRRGSVYLRAQVIWKQVSDYINF